MGETLFSQIMQNYEIKCRIYAPVGVHDDLLGIFGKEIIRKWCKFVFCKPNTRQENRSSDVVLDPIYKWKASFYELNKVIKPNEIYNPSRNNSSGYDLNNVTELRPNK
jgi:RHH-type proline utilization regulon transcriptional repressor/proline dehydrogenase/delta 1-pyrroline-5-carboxylate dehydrogenase